MIIVRWQSLVPDGQYEVQAADGTWGGISREDVMSFPGLVHWNPQF